MGTNAGLKSAGCRGRRHSLGLEYLGPLCFGQSWHWVNQKLGANEAARVLRSGGWWAAWWNHPWADSEDWFDSLLYSVRDPVPGLTHVMQETLTGVPNPLLTSGRLPRSATPRRSLGDVKCPLRIGSLTSGATHT